VTRWGRTTAVCALSSVALLGTSPLASAATHHRRHKTIHHRHRRATRHAPTHHVTQCANADTPATSAPVDAMRVAVVCLVNQQRTQRGLPSLTASVQLDNSAQSWNDVMVSTGLFTHGPGNAFSGRISAAGYDWQSAGENIATGYLTPRGVVKAWMASLDHCQNILEPSYRDVGTGETPSGVSSQQSGPATWTQDFGLQASQSAASSNHGPQNGCPY